MDRDELDARRRVSARAVLEELRTCLNTLDRLLLEAVDDNASAVEVGAYVLQVRDRIARAGLPRQPTPRQGNGA